MQPTFDRLLRRLDPEAAVDVEEAAAVKNPQRTNILWPDRVRPQDQPILGTQPVQPSHSPIMTGSRAPS
jgi:hypothetical protein